MKRVTQPPRRKKKRYTPIITIIAAMVFITIVIVLICVFTIKPNSQETVATPESITSEITSNQSEPGETIPPADSSSNASSSGTPLQKDLKNFQVWIHQHIMKVVV